MHHDCVHAIGHRERFEVGLDGHGEGEFVNKVHWRAGDNRTAAQILEAEDCETRKGNIDVTTGRHIRYSLKFDCRCDTFQCVHKLYYLDITKKRYRCSLLHISDCTINCVFVSCCSQYLSFIL